eukprot:TRINITY_DN69053_c0_g1_i1.p1 TRINITY_DN69053_c0_g1~~TRINITY_DN69053_c0_g1_i1.p1  ORF type:complete len:601 (+),score=49.07 TRINITY_DN69053_c0_g1_i1:42-1844(+)
MDDVGIILVLLACSVFCVLTQVSFVLLDILRLRCAQSCVSCAKAACKVILPTLKCCKRKQNEKPEDALTKMIQDSIDKEKVVLNLKVMRYMGHFWLFYIVSCSIPRQLEALSALKSDWLIVCGEVGPLILLVLTVFFAWCPRFMTSRVIDTMFVFSSLRFILMFLYTENVMQMHYIVQNACFARFAGSLLICNILISLPVNLIVCGCCIFAYSRSSHEPSVLDEIFPSHFADFVFMEVAFTVGTCAFSWIYEHSAKRHNLERRLLAQADATIQQLLSGMCDAVVVLSSDLTIMGRAPKLANLLLRRATGNALAGAKFSDLLLNIELDRFNVFLEQARNNLLDRLPSSTHTLVSASGVRAETPSDLTPALSMPFQLKDVTGSFFDTRLFCSCFLDLNDEISYIIGVCEHNNSPHVQPHFYYRDIGKSQLQTPRDEACSSSSGSDVDALAPLRFESLVVSIDAFSHDLRILSSSTSFDNVICMDTRGRSLLDFVVERELLMSAVQSIVNNVVSGHRESDSLDIERVHVKPPDWNRGLVLRTQCSLVIPGIQSYEHSDFDQSIYEDDDNVLMADLVFKQGHQISSRKLARATLPKRLPWSCAL